MFRIISKSFFVLGFGCPILPFFSRYPFFRYFLRKIFERQGKTSYCIRNSVFTKLVVSLRIRKCIRNNKEYDPLGIMEGLAPDYEFADFDR